MRGRHCCARCERKEGDGSEEQAWVARGCVRGERFVVRKREAKRKLVWRASQLSVCSWRPNLHCADDLSMGMSIKSRIDHSVDCKNFKVKCSISGRQERGRLVRAE